MKYYIKLPNVLVDESGFDSYEDADAAARMITKNTSIRFVSVLQDYDFENVNCCLESFNKKRLLTIIIKPGYDIYDFKQFSQLDKAKKISDYFILQQHGISNYYIKIKN